MRGILLSSHQVAKDFFENQRRCTDLPCGILFVPLGIREFSGGSFVQGPRFSKTVWMHIYVSICIYIYIYACVFTYIYIYILCAMSLIYPGTIRPQRLSGAEQSWHQPRPLLCDINLGREIDVLEVAISGLGSGKAVRVSPMFNLRLFASPLKPLRPDRHDNRLDVIRCVIQCGDPCRVGELKGLPGRQACSHNRYTH